VSRRLRRGVVAAAFALALSTGVAGCAAGHSPESNLVDPDNAEASVGGILARALVMVKADDADAAALAGTFVNRGSTADVLETIQVEAGEGSAGGQAGALSVAPALELPASSAVTVGSGDAPALTVPGAKELKVGTFVRLTLNFRQAGALELEVPLENAEGYYASVTPTPTPSPVSTPTGSPQPGQTGGAVGTTPPTAEATPTST